VARIFETGGGKLAAANSVQWMFKRRGVITLKTSLISEDKLMELVLDAGAEDLSTFNDTYEILTGIESFEPVRKALAAQNLTPESAEMRFLPDNPIEVDVPTAKRVLSLAERLDEHDDVNAVHHSMKITDELVAALKASPE
jgi:transcriptional/translational regulatory protein YebC/TACO1